MASVVPFRGRGMKMGKALLIVAGCLLAGMMLVCGGLMFIASQSAEAVRKHRAERTPEQIQREEERKQRDTERARERAGEAAVIAATERTVSTALKTPSVSRFDLEAYTYDKRLILVTGHVDSQNGFGAMIRTSVQARYVDGSLAYLKVGDDSVKGDLFDESETLLAAWKEKQQ